MPGTPVGRLSSSLIWSMEGNTAIAKDGNGNLAFRITPVRDNYLLEFIRPSIRLLSKRLHTFGKVGFYSTIDDSKCIAALHEASKAVPVFAPGRIVGWACPDESIQPLNVSSISALDKTKLRMEIFHVNVLKLFYIIKKKILRFFMKKKGVIAGNFDVIHPGYIRLFSDAKNACDHLVIALQTDSSVERPEKLKPILTVDERKEVLLSLRFVDEIVVYTTEDDLYNVIREIGPHTRVIGTDYKDRDFTAKELASEIYYHDRNHSWSTTRFKKEIAKSLE